MYTILEVSQKTGLSAHTLRFYEKEGLIRGVSRTQGGFRLYTDEDIEALGLICCLKNTGMPLREIARFMELTNEGEHTLAQRVDLLARHRQSVLEQIDQMQKYLQKVTCKLNFFSEKLKTYEEESKTQVG